MMAMLPKSLVDEYKSKWHDPQMQRKMLNHATNYRCTSPSCYLDLCITEDQAKLLASTMKDAVQGSIIENAMGEGAKKKIARHCINMFEGNIASYLPLINSKEQLYKY